MEINVHIHFENNDKFDKILEAIEKWHEKELEVLIKKMKASTEDLKSTPTN